MEESLLKSVKNLERQGFQKEETLLANLSALDYVLHNAYETRRPTSEDYDKRRDLICVFNEIARELYGNNGTYPVVKEFGSFLMDMFDASSDLDLSINLSDTDVASRPMKIETLRKFTRKLYKLRDRGHVTNVKPIFGARVPVVKVTDCGSGVECDLSVGNLDGIAKSQIVLLISSIDERFQKLCFLMKAWAKAQDINSAADGSLNSLSLILLAAFHLQTRDTPILPPFSAILRDGTDLDTVKKSIHSFMNYGKNNTESLAELFVSLLVKLESVDGLWSEGLCASAFEGSWICKKWIRKDGPTLGCISIEDFTDRSQNASRALKLFETHIKIYTCIHFSLNQVRLFTEGKVNALKLSHLLFGDPSATKKVITLVSRPAMRRKFRKQHSEKKKNQPLPGDLRKGSIVISTTRRKAKPKKKLCASLPTQTVQGSQSENSNLAAPAILADQLVSVSSSSIQGYGGTRPETHHVPPGLMSGQPLSVPKEKKRKQPLPGDLRKGSNVISTTPRKSKPQKKLSRSLPTQTVQGSQPKNLNLAAPALLAGQFVSMSSSSIQGYGGIRPETRHVPPGLMFGRPFSVPNIPYQDSRSFGQERTHSENLSSVAPTFTARPAPAPYLSNQGAGRYRLERIHVQDSRSFGQERTHTENPSLGSSTFTVGQTAPAPSLSNQGAGRYGLERIHVQDSRSFGQERTHTENPGHVSTSFTAGRLAVAPYPPNQGPGRYGLERNHVPDLSFQGHGGFRSQRSHAEGFSRGGENFPLSHPSFFYTTEGTHDQNYRHVNSWDSRSHITMHPNHDQSRWDRSYVPRPSFPLDPLHYPKDSREYENRHGRW